jgi:hypothetical protein
MYILVTVPLQNGTRVCVCAKSDLEDISMFVYDLHGLSESNLVSKLEDG